MSEQIQRMVELAADPAATLADYRKSSGRPAMLIVPLYFPREVLDAAGFIPAEIWGAALPLDESGAFLQPTICSLMVGLFELGLSGGLEGVSGAVFPSTCDTVQNSESIWASRFPKMFVGHVVMPKITSATGAGEFIAAQIREFIAALHKATGATLDDESLARSIALGNTARAAARGLLDLAGRGLLSATERNAVYVLYNLLPFDAFIELAAAAAAQAEQRSPALDAKPVLVSGMVLGPRPVIALYDELGARIVDDDLGIGRRSIDPDVDQNGDPIVALAARQLGRRACCTIHDSQRDRAAELVEQTKACAAEGVIFSRLKFCDPEAFDYPWLSGALKEAGVPSTLLEIDLGSDAIEATTTRMQAFLESL
ncbi:MAG: 2-hydroxyacyl-CoA dehydratase family protein [Candidatus Alcyoniella australis]|nr:2-hydroxyacyl-CoA dehydratase family protein [Candidatus Alcyoniella australis]